MDIIVLANILKGIILIANFYLLFMFVLAILSILTLFGVINIMGGGTASNIYFLIRRIIYPPIDAIARVVPRLGNFDLPFLVFLVLLWIIKDVAYYYINIIQANSFAF
jgi:uncharacterized protein YggT (Ycf19 family)